MTKLRIPRAGVGLMTALVAVGLIATTARTGAAPLAPVLNPAVVLGANVTLSWSPSVGATSYRLTAALQPGGPALLSENVGNLTVLGVSAPIGTYYVKVFASDATGESPASNEIVVQVTSLHVPPAAPTELAAFVNGQSALVTWAPGVGGGAATSFVMHAGSAPGASDIGVFPIGLTTQLAVPSLGPGTYYLRLFAVNQGGASPASNEAALVMPVGGGCSVPPSRTFNAAAFGRYVQFNWAGVPGAAGYRLDFSSTPGGPVAVSLPFGGGATSHAVVGAPLGTFYGKLTTAFSCGSVATGPEVALTIDGLPPPGPRAEDPAPGTRLPFPGWGRDVVRQVAAERPDLLGQSCREHGGNNRFMFEVVRRLRARDNRFGLNWKRGRTGDLSQDIVNYNFSAESDEGTRNVYIVDIVGGHCGPSPSWAWIDQTQATANAGAIGVWTLMPYLQAGYPIVSDQQ